VGTLVPRVFQSQARRNYDANSNSTSVGGVRINFAGPKKWNAKSDIENLDGNIYLNLYKASTANKISEVNVSAVNYGKYTLPSGQEICATHCSLKAVDIVSLKRADSGEVVGVGRSFNGNSWTSASASNKSLIQNFASSLASQTTTQRAATPYGEYKPGSTAGNESLLDTYPSVGSIGYKNMKVANEVAKFQQENFPDMPAATAVRLATDAEHFDHIHFAVR
jgi:hypothetical protein